MGFIERYLGFSPVSVMKLLCIIAAAMAMVVASSAAMAAPKKHKAIHRTNSPSSVPAPRRQWPPNNPTPKEYEELLREGWYKRDSS